MRDILEKLKEINVNTLSDIEFDKFVVDILRLEQQQIKEILVHLLFTLNDDNKPTKNEKRVITEFRQYYEFMDNFIDDDDDEKWVERYMESNLIISNVKIIKI